MSTPELDYIRDLPITPPRARGRGKSATPPEFTTAPQTVTVGSQLAEFTAAVDPGLRAALSNSLLLAQLAADAATGNPAQDVNRWFDAYTKVLQDTGWVITAVDFQDQAFGAEDLLLHKEIIPAVTAFLGPAASATSIVLRLLNSLNEMQQDQPWLTLFQSESQSLHGAKFQIGLVDNDVRGNSTLSLLSIGVEASQRIEQVLFFRTSHQSAKLRKATGSLKITPENLEMRRVALAQKVKEHINDYLLNVRI